LHGSFTVKGNHSIEYSTKHYGTFHKSNYQAMQQMCMLITCKLHSCFTAPRAFSFVRNIKVNRHKVAESHLTKWNMWKNINYMWLRAKLWMQRQKLCAQIIA